LQVRQRPFEPRPNPKLMLDLSDDPVPLPGDHFVRKPQCPIAGPRKPDVPLLILFRIVKWSIEFDDQLGGMTAEIGDEPAHWDLAAEVQVVVTAQSA
jgi:hypothetical protein